MDMLKVFFLTYCYPPQKYPRSVQISHLVQYLRQHFLINVITSLPGSLGDQSLLELCTLDNVTYALKSRITHFIEKSRGYRLKSSILPDIYYPWHFDLYKTTCHEFIKNPPQIIVTFGQPMSTHISGFKLKKKFPYVKWIAHFSDPWVDNIYNEYNSWRKFLNHRYQNKVFKTADLLIFTSQDAIDLATSSYSETIKSKTIFLPHSYNKCLYPLRKLSNKKFTIRYLGNFYGQRQPDCLFKALNILQNKQAIEHLFKVELIGSSSVFLEEQIKAYNLQSVVSILPSVNYLDSLRLMQESDLLLIIDAPTEISPFLPSKLIDYIGANRPIFALTPPGASQKLINEMGFMHADPTNSQDIADKLLTVIHKVNSKQLAPIPEHILNRYSIEVIGEKMSEILRKVVTA